jgi:chromosome segregation ATPase
MMQKVCLSLALVAKVGATGSPTMGAAVQGQSNPLKKVITLLEEMKKQVTAEGSEDAKSYEQYECWCTTSENEKNAAVAEADRRLADLATFMEESTATVGQLKTEIETLTADIAQDEEDLETATGTRKTDNSEFAASEADMKETLAALKDAVGVLSKVQLVQKTGGKVSSELAQSLLQVRNVVQRRFPQFKEVMQRDLFDLMGSMKQESRGAAFLAGNPNYWEPSEEEAGKAKKSNDLQGAAAGAKSYNSRSGEIFGVLRTMNDQFIRDLSNSQKEEFQALVEFQGLRAAKLSEIAAGKEQKESKEKQLADLMAQMATAEEDITALTAARAADLEFLANLKKTCTTEKNEFEGRVKVRNEEIRAIGETIGILTDDDARSLFGKTMSFLQIDAAASTEATVAMQDRLADRAMNRIAKIARKHKNWSLLSLAVRVRLDAFTKVKEMMDKMLVDLQTQQKDEYEKNEQCKADLDKTEDDIKVGNQEKKDLDEKHLQISNNLATLASEIAELKADVAANEVSLKQAGEARKEENQVFQATVSDQRATVNILNKALARLKEFYGFVQIKQHQQAVQEPGARAADPPAKPKGYQKSGAGGGVIAMLEMVIKDAEATEAAAMTAEQEAQASYSTIVLDTKASIEADRDTISLKLEETAKAEGAKAETEGSQSANAAQLAKLGDMLAAFHQDCDWLIKNFDTRQTARAEEMDAITDAKAILSGAKFS